MKQPPSTEEFLEAIKDRDKAKAAVSKSLVELGRTLVEDHNKHSLHFAKETDKDVLIDLYEALVGFAESMVKQQEEISDIRREAESERLKAQDQKGQIENKSLHCRFFLASRCQTHAGMVWYMLV